MNLQQVKKNLQHFNKTGYITIGNRYSHWTRHLSRFPLIGILGYLFSESWINNGKTKFFGKLGLKFYLADIRNGHRKYY